jgi:hypothetical protein
MRSAALFILALLVVLPLVPTAAAEPADVSVGLPAGFFVTESVMLAGAVRADDAAWSDVTFLDAEVPTFTAGVLTVCPQEGGSATVLDALRRVGQDCRDASTFEDPTLRFGLGSDAVFAGAHTVATWPAASTVGFYGPDVTTMVMSDDGVGLAREGDLFRFAGTTSQTSLEVTDADGNVLYFNGTAFAFLHDAERVTLTAAGGVGRMEPTALRVSEAPRAAIEQAIDPFLILDLQTVALGPDGREPRANVTGLFLEFGRVPSFVNGALFGRLNGTAASVSFDNETALVRGNFTLEREEERLTGTVEPTVVLGPDGVAFGGGKERRPPWMAVLGLWIAAIVLLALRRRAPKRADVLPWVWGAAILVALALADQAILADDLGTSGLQELRGGAGSGAVLALFLFEITLVALAFALVALPLRLIAGRLLDGRPLVTVEIVLAVAWLLTILLAPASYFALTHAVARL